MWARLDDELIDHPKILAAGSKLGRDGPCIALGFFALGLMWSNKHLSDGHLPMTVVKSFRHVANPTGVADALCAVELWQRENGGYVIRHFNRFNPSAASVRAKREKDRQRKAES